MFLLNRFVVPAEVVELYMIHLGGFFYDLAAGFILNIQCTKKLAFLLSFMFHGMNSQLFTIGKQEEEEEEGSRMLL